VEHGWFQRVLRGRPDVPWLYWSPEHHDLDFDGAVADRAVVEDGFTSWKAEIDAQCRPRALRRSLYAAPLRI
jgi:hypothetical protein